jgi:hypothetical protein
MNTSTTFNPYNFYVNSDYNFVDHDYINLSSTQKIFYTFGKGTKKIANVLKKPETKASVLIANWAASSMFLVMTAFFATSPAVIASALALLAIETYAVFGTAEYAIAYSIAQKFNRVNND